MSGRGWNGRGNRGYRGWWRGRGNYRGYGRGQYAGNGGLSLLYLYVDIHTQS